LTLAVSSRSSVAPLSAAIVSLKPGRVETRSLKVKTGQGWARKMRRTTMIALSR